MWGQLPYLAKLEKAGIPTVLIDYSDQTEMVKQTALAAGVPKIRYLHASRTLPGPADVDSWIDRLVIALTGPLTEEEKESGHWKPSAQERVLFEGTLDEAHSFYHKTEYVPFPVDAPVAVYTDGLPVVIPTEERVGEMLKGTNHSPDEVVTYRSDRPGAVLRGGRRDKGDIVRYQPRDRTATVEKVATIAVMAGCRPEYLPVVLAIAESGCATGTTTAWSQWACVSGPIAKEIGMSSGCGMLDPGNPANMAIGRSYQLMAINLGGALPGINRMNSIGSPFNTGGTCFAENTAGLPPGWEGLNEEYGFRKNESIVMVVNGGSVMTAAQFSPGLYGYRGLQKSGGGGMAKRMGVTGKPGPHNWLEYLVPGIWANREGGQTFIMVPEMARHLYEFGFKSKEAIYDWLYERSQVPLKEYMKYSWPDFHTNLWTAIEPTTGKPWNELPDDFMVPAAGNDPFDNCIIVGGGEEEVCTQFAGRSGLNSAYGIDAWR